MKIRGFLGSLPRFCVFPFVVNGGGFRCLFGVKFVVWGFELLVYGEVLSVGEGCVLVKNENLSFLGEFCSVLCFSFCGEWKRVSLFVWC